MHTNTASTQIVRRLVDDVISGGDLDQLKLLVTPDYAYHAPGIEVRGAEGIGAVFTMLRSAFPDWRESIEDLIAADDRVVFRVTGRGTHRGEFMGRPPTGARVEVAGIDIVRLEDERIAEHWAVFDQFGLLQQIDRR
jgi:steroid delta-isomerase-like uncharacterized protein